MLLLLDMFSDVEFEGGAELCRAALPVARRIRVLKREAARRGVPTIYVNDHCGRWRADPLRWRPRPDGASPKD